MRVESPIRHPKPMYDRTFLSGVDSVDCIVYIFSILYTLYSISVDSLDTWRKSLWQ